MLLLIAAESLAWTGSSRVLGFLTRTACSASVAHGMGASCTRHCALAEGPRRAGVISCGLVDLVGAGGGSDDAEETTVFDVGQRVRVKSEATLMHVPGHKAGYQAQGAEGTVVRQYKEPNLSPNRDVKVEFSEPKKWVGHFEAWELEVLDES